MPERGARERVEALWARCSIMACHHDEMSCLQPPDRWLTSERLAAEPGGWRQGGKSGEQELKLLPLPRCQKSRRDALHVFPVV